MSTTNDRLTRLREILGEVQDFSRAASVLEWDQQTYMPRGGSAARGRQLGTLRGTAHRLFASDEVGRLLETLEPEARGWPYDSDDAGLIRLTTRHYRRARRIPSELVGAIAGLSSTTHEAWIRARAARDFGLFAPSLARMVDLKRQVAEHLRPWDHPYDALLDEFEPELRTAEVRSLFETVRQPIVSLVRELGARSDRVSDTVLRGDWDVARQRSFGEWIARRLGYDFDRGRLDDTVHPFCTTFAIDDVRITCRYDPGFLPPALYGIMHEVGHALYEQGVAPELARTGLDDGASLGIHESQSRLWENLVGRSRPFWQFALPHLQRAFPEASAGADVESVYRAVNRVGPSLIRVEADEVTYTLHILVRFEVETRLIEGSLEVAGLPDAWNELYERYLGIRPPDDLQGVLQDVHWTDGTFGYFPTYSIGSIVAVQLWESARRALPDLDQRMAAGDFSTLLGWLRANVHRHGSKFTPRELVERATGRPMDTAPYLAYLKTKFGEIYGV